MLSTNRQCEDLAALVAAMQACLDRRGRVIPCREVDLGVFVARARSAMGITSCASSDTVARDFYKSGTP